MINIWEKKLAEATANLEGAEKEVRLAELELEESKNKTGIESWLGYTFESSSMRTPEYSQFERQIKNYIKKLLDKNLELIAWSKQHFEFSGFIKNKLTDKLVYFSCSDVRFFPDAWYNNLLIRTAENEKDYTGGSNDYCKLLNLSQKALLLTL